MAASLVPCPSCARHVRSSERACPFCRSALSTDLAARAVPGTTQRLSRAAAFTFAASLAATGCASDPVPNDAATVTDTGSDAGTIVTDTGPADTGAPTDTGAPADTGTQADAGAPVDAGKDGSIGVRYGSPPRPDAGF